MKKKKETEAALTRCLRELRLPVVRQQYESLAQKAEQESLGYEEYLLEVLELERESRRHKRMEKLLRDSRLPLSKSFDCFEMGRLPRKVAYQVKALREGSFLGRSENVLAFGNPGSGKTHLLCALGQDLIRNLGRRVYYAKCDLLVQALLKAKQELKLARLLKKLSRYEALIIDDLGYVQQSREEMEVLFTLLAERYESGSVMLTSNLPFSKWESIFKDPMVTAAAIDRLIHHSVIVELNLPSYRIQQAKAASTPKPAHEEVNPTAATAAKA
jgi:DNA replication protein DnaC